MQTYSNKFENQRFKLVIVTIVTFFLCSMILGFLIHTGTATAPLAPVLKAPNDNAYLNDTTPKFEWFASYDNESDPLRYEIHVDEKTGDWSSLVINYTTDFNVTSWQTGSSLSDGSYKWRARANDNLSLPDSKSIWSAVWYFTIDTIPPSIVAGSGDFTAYTGDPFTVYVNYTGGNVSSVSTSTIYYKKSSEVIYRAQIMLESTTNHFYINSQFLGLNTTNDDDDYVYYILAVDKAENKFKYSNTGGSDFIITVLDNDRPEVISGTGDIITTTDDEFSILIDCVDNIALGDATLFVRKLDSQWQNIELNKFSHNKFIINYSELKSGLDLNTSDGIDYEYYILVYDSSNNIFNYSNSSGEPWKIVVDDNDGPKATIGSGNLIVTTDDPFTIRANFTDNIDVINANLFIREMEIPETGWSSKAMIEGFKNNFSINYDDLKSDQTIQMNTATGGIYEYYVLAKDIGNNHCNYSQAIDRSWTIRVVDNDPPTLVNGSGDLKVTTDDPFMIYANLIDNIDVSNAQIFIRQVDSETWSHAFMLKEPRDNINRFEISYDVIKSDLEIETTYGGSLEYYIIANDSEGNDYNYFEGEDDFWEILITDNDPPLLLASSGNFSVMTNVNFTIYAIIYDNTEVTSATIHYKMMEVGEEFQSGPWSKYDMISTGSPFEPEPDTNGNSNGNNYKFYNYTVTNHELGLEMINNDFYLGYYITVSDESGNVNTFGDETNPYKITIVDNDPPIIESISTEPKDLTAAYDDDFIVRVKITDLGGSGLDDQSVMIRYKRGSYDSTYHDHTNMAPSPSLDYGEREWQFAIPRPLRDENSKDTSIRYNWELVIGEDIDYEIRCKDLEGNVFESGVLSEYVDVVPINHAPNIELIAPTSNENVSGQYNLYWLATDPDNDELFVAINISEDNGQSWKVLTSDMENNGTYLWDTTKFQNGDNYLIKIIANDKELVGYDTIKEPFTIYNADKKAVDGDLEKPAMSTTDNLLLASAGISVIVFISSLGFISGTEIGKYKFFSLLIVPLYSRIHHDEVLDNFTRGQIFGYIKARPGEHYNSIKESLGLTNGTLSHHLRILEKEEFIHSLRDGFNARFYPKGFQADLTNGAQMTKLQEMIFNKISQQPGISQHELVTQFGASQQVISYNLTKLVREEKIRIVKQGRENTYYATIPELSVIPYRDQTQPGIGKMNVPVGQPNQPTQTIYYQTSYQPPPITPKESQIPTTNQQRLPPAKTITE